MEISWLKHSKISWLMNSQIITLHQIVGKTGIYAEIMHNVLLIEVDKASVHEILIFDWHTEVRHGYHSFDALAGYKSLTYIFVKKISI